MEEARNALSEYLDAAVLDVNLDGELVYELAGELRNRGKPIIFVTGYHAAAIDQEFGDVPVLTKPMTSAASCRSMSVWFVEREQLVPGLASNNTRCSLKTCGGPD